MTTENDVARYLHCVLRQMQKKFKKQALEIADIFVRCSGDLKAMEHYMLRQMGKTHGKAFYTEWQHVEDQVLMSNNEATSETHDYQVLQQLKGVVECTKRRQFLQGSLIINN